MDRLDDLLALRACLIFCFPQGPSMRLRTLLVLPLVFALFAFAQQPDRTPELIGTYPKHVSTDSSVKIDYDIAYIRFPRKGDAVGTNWAEIANPVYMDAGADLMLLHPDGSEEV